MRAAVAIPVLSDFGALSAPNEALADAVWRVRPGDPRWPSESDWDRLKRQVKGRLVKVTSPLAQCIGSSNAR